MRGFVFQSPGALALLVALLPLAVVFARARAKRMAVVRLLGGSTTSHPPARDALRLAALALAMIALARPGIDPQVISSEQSGRDVVFAVDVSRSMLAEDVAPSRLEAAKQAVRDVLVTLRGQRVGLVVYAGSASILCPLTDDYDFIRYMLDQANPDTVDFGGTQWQSAMEKITGQVFDAERRGFSDLVLLTDGDDQGDDQERVAESLREAGTGLLLVGLGDAGDGVKIPVVDTEGRRSWIEAKGEAVRTRMNREALTALAASLRGARFFEAGTSPFDLGAVYRDYAATRPTGAPAGGASHTVYRELAFGLIAMVVILLALAQGWPLRWRARVGGRVLGSVRAVLLVVMGVVALLPLSGRADVVSWRAAVAVAMAHQDAGRLEQAIEVWTGLGEAPSSVSAAERAVVVLNRGLALEVRASQLGVESPSIAWVGACRARDDFLAACRLDPSLVRAGKRLDSTAKLMAEIQVRLDAEAQQNAEKQAALSALLKRLNALLNAQDALHAQVPNLDKNRTDAPPPPPEPAQVEALCLAQSALTSDATTIQSDMVEIDRQLSVPVPVMPAMQSILQEPLVLIHKAVAAQSRARDYLLAPGKWSRARQEQAAASGHIRAILQLLASTKPADKGDADDSKMSDAGEADSPTNDDASAESASPSGTDDMAQASAMQPLPKPNYSVQDILKEESANQQFRQQKRATTQAGKVEKNW